MLRLLGSLCIIGALARPLVADIEIKNYVENRTIMVKVNKERLLRTPVWRTEAVNPPVSPKRAIGLANEMRKALVKDTARFKWRFVSAKLVRDTESERWYWKIGFEARVRAAEPPDYPQELELVVLMDGTAVQPIVTPVNRSCSREFKRENSKGTGAIAFGTRFAP
jgi:hypothetical protein